MLIYLVSNPRLQPRVVICWRLCYCPIRAFRGDNQYLLHLVRFVLFVAGMCGMLNEAT